MKKIVGISLLALMLVLANYFSPYIRLFTGEGIGKAYTFQNSDGSFMYDLVPSKGGDIEQMESAFSSFNTIENRTDTTLFRTFPKQPLKFWNWQTYMTHPLYDYPLI